MSTIMARVKPDDIRDLIAVEGGTCFAEFVKRGDSTVRNMSFTLPELAGAPAVPTARLQEDMKKKLLTVWDVNENSYRRLDLATVRKIVIGKSDYVIDHR